MCSLVFTCSCAAAAAAAAGAVLRKAGSKARCCYLKLASGASAGVRGSDGGPTVAS